MDHAAQIGSQTLVSGSIRGKGPLAIAGRVDGTVHLEGDCLVMGKAVVNAGIEAESVEVRGAVKGDIKARAHVVVAANAQVDGVIDAPRIEIDPQARVRGRLQMALQLPRGLRVRESRDPWNG
jgi:cytoskeletal protein CcmA (bactofilin family)